MVARFSRFSSESPSRPQNGIRKAAQVHHHSSNASFGVMEMATSLDRRTALKTITFLGPTAFLTPLYAAEGKDAEPPASFAGTWTYRSFINNPDITADFNKLEFARATLIIEKAPFGALQGRLTFGNDFL